MLRAPGERAVGEPLGNVDQGAVQPIRLGLPQQLEPAKLGHVGAAGGDVVLGQRQVDLERLRQCERRVGGGGLEATVPQGGLARGVHLSIHTRWCMIMQPKRTQERRRTRPAIARIG